jgi:hypothetical protein
VVFQPKLALQRFSGNSALDSNNGSLLLSAQRQGELATVAASAQIARDSTLTTELLDTGIVNAATRQDTRSGSLSITRNLTESQQIQTDASWADVTYPGGLQFGLVGYRYPSIDLVYSIAITPRTTLSSIGFGSQSTAPLVHYESSDYGARLTIDHSLSLRMHITASLGASESRVRSVDDHGLVWSTRLTREDELNHWALSYERSVQPSGNGLLVNRDLATLSLARSVAPKLYATVAVTAVRNTDLGPALQETNRRYFTGDAGLEWRESPEWVFSFTGGASDSHVTDPDQTARGWHTGLRINWSPQRWSASR